MNISDWLAILAILAAPIVALQIQNISKIEKK